MSSVKYLTLFRRPGSSCRSTNDSWLPCDQREVGGLCRQSINQSINQSPISVFYSFPLDAASVMYDAEDSDSLLRIYLKCLTIYCINSIICFSILFLLLGLVVMADISAKLSLVCPAKRNANLWMVILCTELMANKFDLIWFDVTGVLPSTRLFVRPVGIPWLTRRQHATRPAYLLGPTIRITDIGAGTKLIRWYRADHLINFEVKQSSVLSPQLYDGRVVCINDVVVYHFSVHYDGRIIMLDTSIA